MINVVIVDDSLRYDSYNELMPQMKGLAKQGLEFTDARSMGRARVGLFIERYV